MLAGWEARATQGRPLDVALEMPLLAQRIIVRTMFGTDLGEEGPGSPAPSIRRSRG
jgi:hypothetical protein